MPAAVERSSSPAPLAGPGAGLAGGAIAGFLLGTVLVAGGCPLGALQAAGILLAATVAWSLVGGIAGFALALPARLLPPGLRGIGAGLALALPGAVLLGFLLRSQGEATPVPPWLASLVLLAGGIAAGLALPPIGCLGGRPARLAGILLALAAVAGVLELAGRPVHRLDVVHRPPRDLSSAAARPPAPLPFPAPRNVLLLLVDTLRADHLSCYGYPRATSPEIDRLARGGVPFAAAFAQNPKTSPSVATILSGTYPHTHGIATVHTWLPDRVLLLPEILGPRGRDTASFVANPNVGPGFNFQQGFATMVEVGDRTVRDSAARLNRRVIPWLREHRDRPFFLYVHYIDPHPPYDPPPPWRDMFVDDELWGRWDGHDAPLGDGYVGRINRWLAIDGSSDVDLYVARYDAEIRYVDTKIGELLAELEHLGLAEDTLVVLVADHGESMAEHGVYFNHGLFLYENNVHVPLIFRLPGRIPAGRVVTAPVETVDIAPTILDLLGIPTPPVMEGRSLLPLLLGEGSPAPRPVFMEAGARVGRQRKGIRTGSWKLVYDPDGIDLARQPWAPSFYLHVRRIVRYWATRHGGPGRWAMWSLWDLREDPGETRDLYRERPDVVARLRPLLAAWIAREPADRHPRRLRAEEMDPDLQRQLRSLGYVR